jgi:hypothetical protein
LKYLGTTLEEQPEFNEAKDKEYYNHTSEHANTGILGKGNLEIVTSLRREKDEGSMRSLTELFSPSDL